MSREHKLLIGGFLGVLAVQISALQGWSEVLQPVFVGTTLAQFAIFLKAIYSDKPEAK